MSGDASTYVRGKAQERQGADATFMMDGFSRWAESEAPYRVGGAEKEGCEAKGSRHRSSKALHRHAEMEMSGAGRFRGRSPGRRRRSSRSSSSSSSDSSSDDSSSDPSSDSSSGSSVGRGRRRRGRAEPTPEEILRQGLAPWASWGAGRRRGRAEPTPEEILRQGLAPWGGAGRRHRGGKSSMADMEAIQRQMLENIAKVTGMTPDQVQANAPAMELVNQAVKDQVMRLGRFGSAKGMRRRNQRHRAPLSESEGSESESSSGSESDSSHSTESGRSTASSCSGGRRRRGGSVKDDVTRALDYWYNTSLLGAPLAKWTTMPTKIKEIVDKINQFWGVLTGPEAAPIIATIKKSFSSKAPGMVRAIESLGFGRRHVGKHLNRGLLKVLKLHLTKRGGDAFDDKLKTYGSVATAGDALLKSKAPSVEKGVRSLYNAYAGVADNADLVDSVLAPVRDKSPALVNGIMKITAKARSLRQSGLGKKGKRKPSERNMLVSKLMREHGLTLGEASKRASTLLKKSGSGEL